MLAYTALFCVSIAFLVRSAIEGDTQFIIIDFACVMIFGNNIRITLKRVERVLNARLTERMDGE